MGTRLVERGITRYDIDEQGTYGYMMRISRSGEHTNEFFSDKNYKGKRQALAAARVRYQELVESLPPPKTTKGVKTARNQTGVVGVHLAVCESIYGEEYSSYCASWKTADGKRNKISFSFKKYGKQKSWEMACLARELETTDRVRVEKLFNARKKKNKKIAPPPKPTTLARSKKATKKSASSKASGKSTKTSIAKKKNTKKKSTTKKTAKTKVTKKTATKKKNANKKSVNKKSVKKKSVKKKSVKKKSVKKKSVKKKSVKKKSVKKKSKK